MELRQKLALKNLLIPELNQSLKILCLPIFDLKCLIENELLSNPFLQEIEPKSPTIESSLPPSYRESNFSQDNDFKADFITKKPTLEEALLRQLGMFANTDEEVKIGQEIIGNLNENGYLKIPLLEIASSLSLPLESVEKTLKLIQQFEPAGVGARNVSECLRIQLELCNECTPTLKQIIEEHLEDIAKKNYSRIAKCLSKPLEEIEPCIRKVLRLDPKPGRNYCESQIQTVKPDIFIEDDEDEFQINISDEDLPSVSINKDYRKALKDTQLNPQTKEFLTAKLKNALELFRSIYRRKATLRRIVETIVEIQQEAIRSGLSNLKPLTFKEVAEKINMHESTVCRAVMNKYVKLPFGVVPLKDFFSSKLQGVNGESVSSNQAKKLIKELIDNEDKKKPLSDSDITKIIAKENGLKLARRTVAKYREELKVLSSTYRKIR